MFPCSWWMNTLVPISPLHKEQPTPQHSSGIWIGLPLHPIFCITIVCLTFKFTMWILVFRKKNYLPHHKHSSVKVARPKIFPHLFFLLFVFISVYKIYVISLQCILSPKANPSGYIFPSKYKLFCSPVIIWFA